MKFAHMAIAFMALSLPAAAMAQVTVPADAAPAPAPASATTKPAADPNKVICKVEEDTGSLISKHKTCLTAAQWRDRAFRAGQWAEHQQTYNSQPNGR